jgi:hypothetical protein
LKVSVGLILPFISTIIMAIFTAYVLQRYFARRRLSFLFWGLGLAMFGIGSLSEALLAFGWNRWVFFAWYLFGAVLNPAWIGQGTVYLLAKKRRAHQLTAILVAASVIAAIMLLMVMPDLNPAVFSPDTAISEQYKEIMPAIADGGYVRLTPIPFGMYGLVTLVGGALWSSYLFWRKRVMPNRVVGNILIAVGALVIASASTLTGLGSGQVLYAGELLAAIFMFAGFLLAGAPRAEPAADEAATASNSA